MRVVAGIHKGRSLKAVPSNSTRPTTDKVKEAVFQMLGPFFDGGAFLDLFAGSGALGIEALSRGMSGGIFVDKHPKAIHTIKENIKLLKLDEHVEIYRADAFRALKACAKRNAKFDLILLDPPYGRVDYNKLINQIMELELLKEDGLIYCEYEPTENFSDIVSSLDVVRQGDFGGTIGFTIYRKNGEE